MSYDFHTTTHGKWILAGEHAVLRGHPLLLFPLHDQCLTLDYNASSELNAHFSGSHSENLHWAFWGVLERGCGILNIPLEQVRGQFFLHNDISIGVGLGASAALCVALARWFAAYDMIPPATTQDFAKQLENLFHGQSSGADIAGVTSSTGVYFKQGRATSLHPTWQPQWRLSSCKQMGKTLDCIQKVNLLREQNVILAERIDQQMTACVSKAREALESASTQQAMPLLVDAINTASDCFQQWGLISESLQRHMDNLRSAGALAVKPTGSGGGGHVISLWAAPPPMMDVELINLWSHAKISCTTPYSTN